MKYLQRLLLLLTFSAAIFSCQKEYSIENPTGPNGTAQWEFKEGGVQFKGSIDTASIDTLSNFKFLNITGHAADGSVISLQAFGTDIKAGTYKTPFSLFAYVNGSSSIYQTDQSAADSFTIVITKVDSFSISGTFSGKAVNGTTPKTIVDGKFSAALKSGAVVTPVTDSGQVVLWSKTGCGGGTSTNPITVSVAGKSGQITSFSATEPTTCDPAGTFHLKLPVGTYPWVAKCGTDSVKGTVTVTKDGCTKQQVDFTAPIIAGDYFPTTKNSYWLAMYDPAAAPSDSTITYVTGDSLKFANSFFKVFIYEDYKFLYYDSLFYRKSNGNYNEYYPAAVNFFGFDTATAVEYTFLKDNVSIGATWSTPIINGTITDSLGKHAVVARVDGTILDKVASVTVGGKTYTDVIKVRNSYLLGVGTPVEGYRVEQWFAKGIGLIKWQEFVTPFTAPATVQNTLNYYIAP